VPPVSVLFAAFLGYNPVENLVGAHALAALSPANHAALTGRTFFPRLISAPFSSGLHEAFAFAIVACLIAAGASLLRGGKYHYAPSDAPAAPGSADGTAEDQRNGAHTNGAAPSLQDITITHTPTKEEQHAG
jgi:hypothetical protein